MANTTVELHIRYQDLINAQRAAEQLDQTLRQMQNRRINLQLQSNDALTRAYGREAQARYAARDALEQQRRAEQEYNDMAQQHLRAQIDLINGLSAAIRGLGSVSQMTAQFAEGIGSSFSAMRDIFKTDISSYAVASLTHQFMRNLVGNVPNVTSRYDILRTFVPYMSLMGVPGIQASNAQSRLNESILGLPIGLDEATQRLRRYFMYTNDLNYATDLAIGVQNAIVAGGSGESYQTQAYNMIERMLATGNLTNIRQWQSLLVGLGVSQRYIEQELGLGQGELLEKIRSKDISVQEFLDALARIGSGASEAAQGINDALDIYRSTIESWMKNIEFAVIRGNERVLGAVNDTLEAVTGKGIVEFMHEYRDFLNTVFYGTADFIRANPDLLKNLLDDGEKILSALSDFSASRFAQNISRNLSRVVEGFLNLLSKVPARRLEDFASFALTIAGPVGKLFSAVSSGAPAMIAIFNRFENFDFNVLIDAIARNVDTFAGALETLLNIFTDEQLANIIAFGLVYGRPFAAFFNTLGNFVTRLGIFFAMGGAERLDSVFHLIGGGLGNAANTAASAAAAVAASPFAIPLAAAATVVGGGLMYRNSVNQFLDDAYSQDYYLDSTVTGSRRYHRRLEQIAEAEAAYEAARLASRSSLQRNPNAEPYMLGETNTMRYYRGAIEWLRRAAGRAAPGWRADVTNRLINRGLDPIHYFPDNGRAGDVEYGASGIGRSVDIEIYPLTDEALQLTKSLYDAAAAYDELYASARESLVGQFSLWEDFELNDKIPIGKTKSRMEVDAGYANRFADAIEYISDYVEKNPNAAGYVSAFVNDLSIADLPTIEALVAQIESGAELPLDAWNALEAAIDRCTEALIRFHSVADEKEYDKDSAWNYFANIFGDSNAVRQEFENLWGETETLTETGLETMRKTMGDGLKDIDEVTEYQVAQIDGDIRQIGSDDPDWMYQNMKALMLALKAGIVDWGDEAVREAWRIAHGIHNAWTYAQISTGRGDNTPKYSWETELRAEGGMIYASNGQFVPVGTDTVPAMLTPGEFVMRKRAVNTFGARFMKYVNDLNIGAAFDSLVMSRDRLLHGNSVTYNNSRDNHATVNQNIITNSPGFTYKRAGRFVRGLA